MLRRAAEGEIPAVAALIAAHPLALLQQDEGWLREIADGAARGVLVWDEAGISGFAVIDWDYPGVMGLWNVGVLHTGRGVGQRLIRAVLDEVFGQMGAHRLFCDAAFDNDAALAAFAKAGFAREGVMRECWQREPGIWVDCVAFSILAHEWRART